MKIETFSGGDIRQGNKKKYKMVRRPRVSLLNLSRRMDFFFPNRFLLFSGDRAVEIWLGLFCLHLLIRRLSISWGSRG